MILLDTEDFLLWLFLTEGLYTASNYLLLLLEPIEREEKPFTDIGTNVIILTGESL